jgi:hypothetical protein
VAEYCFVPSAQKQKKKKELVTQTFSKKYDLKVLLHAPTQGQEESHSR